MSGMLDGVRIVDLTRLLPGPYATLRLAELGAEVIKVEDAKGGDPARHSGPKSPSGDGLVFRANHRGKKSLFADLQNPAGRNEVLDLVRCADVVVESFRPGRMRSFGLDYESLRQVKEDIILCSITSYGQSGPLHGKAGHDLNFVAESGILSLLSGSHGTPVPPAIQWGDLLGGIVACEAIVGALLQREKTGQGQHLDVGMTDALVGLLPTHVAIAEAGYGEYGIPELTGSLLCYGLYQTKDQRQVALAALEPKFWKAFCEGVHHPEWISHPFTPTSVNNPIYNAVMAEFQSRTQAEWEDFGLKVDCCLSPVRLVSEAVSALQHRRPQSVCQDEQTGLRTVRTHAGGHR